MKKSLVLIALIIFGACGDGYYPSNSNGEEIESKLIPKTVFIYSGDELMSIEHYDTNFHLIRQVN